MWKWISLIALTYTLFVLQGSLAPALAVQGVTPHLVLAALVPLVLRMPARLGLAIAATWGLLCDCLAADGMGAHLIAFGLIALALQLLRRQSLLTSPLAVTLPGLLLMSAGLAAVTAVQAWHARQAFDRTLFIPPAQMALYSSLILLALLLVGKLLTRSFVSGAPTSADPVANRWKMLTE